MRKLIGLIVTVVLTIWTTSLFANVEAVAATQSSPILTWNRIALEAVERAKPGQHQALRLLAYVSLAQHAAVAEVRNPDSLSETLASASMRVIAGLLPSQEEFVKQRYRELHPNGSARGVGVAHRVLALARKDGFTQPWQGQQPQAAYVWRSLANPPAPPAFPGVGGMRTFFLESGDVFRSAPPPSLGSVRFYTDLAEVRGYTESPTEQTIRLAEFYDMTTGTLVAGFWNSQASALIRGSAASEAQITTVLATVNAAMMDAIIACHDAKYAYWVPRPRQVDPSIKPLIGVPNHPSYPSNHSCVSTAAALVLSHFFPQASSSLLGIAGEAGLSRIYAGLHFRFDVEAGEEIGRKVAATAIARYPQLLGNQR